MAVAMLGLTLSWLLLAISVLQEAMLACVTINISSFTLVFST